MEQKNQALTYRVALLQFHEFGDALVFVDVVVVCKNAFPVYGALEWISGLLFFVCRVCRIVKG